ncbi:MAG TPA: hypothetical protein VIY86_04195, partial [Pirellulaceae bacterium]
GDDPAATIGGTLALDSIGVRAAGTPRQAVRPAEAAQHGQWGARKSSHSEKPRNLTVSITRICQVGDRLGMDLCHFDVSPRRSQGHSTYLAANSAWKPRFLTRHSIGTNFAF